MALSDILKLASTASMFIPGAQVATPFLGAAAAGVGMVESQNENNNPKRVSPEKIRTGDPLEYTDIMKFDREGLMFMTTPKSVGGNLSRIINESSKVDWTYPNMEGVELDASNIDWNEDFVQPDRISDQFLPNALNPNNVGANNNLGPIFNNGNKGVKGVDGSDGGDLKSTNPDMLEMLGEIGKAAGFADNMNKVSLGLAGVSAVTGLISEMNADKPRIAPYVKSNRVNLDSDTSAFENASEARMDKTYRSTLSSLINRGLSPVMANAVAGSMKNNTSNETLAKAEQFRTQTENQEAGMNAEVSARNAQGMNQHNRYVEQWLAKRNQMASENVNSHLSSLIQIPAMLGQSKMDKNKFITDSYSALFRIA